MRPLFLSAAFLVVAAGCGGEEKLYDVSGTVTWGGQPIPKGQIFFDPDASKGTAGTQGFATVENGKFDTKVPLKGRGLKSGHYTVRVSGFDGKPGMEAPFGEGLFPEYTTTKEFPAADSVYELDVPKGGAKKK